ncbi:MAG: hypothetical protein CUN49_06200 [Candidatus Thermofonsia Clade 1 bacterium]|jgi:hypothetical protein|uniref:DUF3426 domain-containing protein n=1 Tax=Candidatus Thermofonsia Clade 1 bacterium TaxID=2364210 RepID=A0A2M8PFG5_9CHLR|nr:MAG: hypothetical protein CUN49_06200 [Candidatus Thermofonsia Clade 1 bacterium]RMF49459.1 MAG: DUF3426 domain-containing protein [Chloroflexota bacterium]
MIRRLAYLLVLLLSLSACNGAPGVLIATPLPPDADFRTYRHPSGVFTLRLPPEWSVRDVSDANAVRAEFSAPNANSLPLSVYILNSGTPLSATALIEQLDRYLQIAHGSAYREVNRSAQGDGSWRVVGVRQTGIGERVLNTFVQADGTFLSVIEADVTDLDEAALRTLRAVINTLRVDPNAALRISDLNQAPEVPVAAVGSLLFSALHSWTAPNGDFIINGMLTNAAGAPLEAIRVTALLYDANDTVLSEQANVLSAEILMPNASAPFSIRFRGGKPSRAVRYELRSAARHAEFALQNYLGEEAFIRGNEIARYNANGFLTVSGDIVNQTQGAANFVKIIVAVLDDQGRVVATDSTFLNRPVLLPGEAARFEIVFPELGGSAIRYVISVEGKRG